MLPPHKGQQKKRHHYVPKAYLKAFCNEQERLLVYRKDNPSKPLSVTPDATQFRKYYYSQPAPEGGQDNNTLEDLFSSIERDWPATVEKLHNRENVNDRLEHIFQFMTLQRVRVPAARDAFEAMQAQMVKDAMMVMLANGELPPLPPGLEDLPNKLQISIDPHRSLHAMALMMKGMAKLYSALGLVAIHNVTTRPFLTSDNPVIWFDPSLPFDEQLPYTINPDGGPILFIFPVSPRLALIGSNTYKEAYGQHGLLHSDEPNEACVKNINEQICRFAYEAVIATENGHESMIAQYAHVSPVHEAIALQTEDGIATIHRQVFGARSAKPKWQTP